jgi:hypothetical protein
VINFQLAWIYRTIAINTPLELSGLERDQHDVQKDDRKHDLLMAANVISALLTIVLGFVYQLARHSCQSDPQSCRLESVTFEIYAASIGLVTLLQIVSGVILVSSLKEIRFYFVKTHALDQLNVKQMLLHGGAFGFYLIAAVIYFVSFVLKEVVRSPWTVELNVVCF